MTAIARLQCKIEEVEEIMDTGLRTDEEEDSFMKLWEYLNMRLRAEIEKELT